MAQEAGNFSAGLGAGLNLYSPDRFAFGAALAGEYRLPADFSASSRLEFSFSPDGLFALEPGLFVRWYPSFIPLFLEAGGGASLLFKDQEFHPLGMGSGGLGFRLPLGSWYAEALVRGLPVYRGRNSKFRLCV
jgi:hypothetical protein